MSNSKNHFIENNQSLPWNKGELFNWLASPRACLNAGVYSVYFPDGFEYVSLPKAKNCIDYILGHYFVRLDTLRIGKNVPGNIVAYTKTYGQSRPDHLGIILDDGRVESQWNGGCVFWHGIDQVPQTFGDIYSFYLLPQSINANGCAQY